MNAVHASSTAELLTTMRIRVNLPRMERRLKARISILLPCVARHQPGHGDYFRTDLQVGFGSGLQVDLQPHSVPFNQESNHASRLREATPLTDGQHLRSFLLPFRVQHTLLVLRIDKEHIAASQILSVLELPHHHWPDINELAGSGLGQQVSKRIFANDPQDYWSACIGKGAFRPLYEFREVKKETGFDLMFTQSLGL
jgi:hypothetical protein